MRTSLAVVLLLSALLLSALAAVPTASAGEAPERPDVCLEWDTGDFWCVLSDTPGYVCVFTIERGPTYYTGTVCYRNQPTPEACALVDQDGETLCVRV